ncbi:MAG: formylglycine-generating enzyme family protein [Campylobacteraceae bacterium]|jgi:formylglycine-generating enzyme required for sulfatase activity|nr:formylglycine-generating enzyme family protein [Campylobacteraceae bacterium]
MKYLLFLPLVFGFAFGANSIGIEFVKIPQGSFMMGCDEANGFCLEDEMPRRKVVISQPFYLGKYEVTQKQWRALMGNNPSMVKGDSFPVTNVSWNDINTFIKKLNEKESTDKYRLPTEAEWEYAVRAGSDTRFFWGNSNEYDITAEYAWLESNSNEKIQKVGQKKPNAWGLYDMAGNVWEFISDLYGKDYYHHSILVDPKSNSRGVRGSSYYDNSNFARSASRGNGFYDEDESLETVGFRLAMSMDEKEISAEYRKMKETFKLDFGEFYAKAFLSFFDGHGGYIVIYDKKTDENLISVEVWDLYYEGEIKDWQKFAKERNLIIHEDFNFDGKKDFAVYHGEANLDYSYDIYLRDAKGFTYNEKFSYLTHQGMFETDAKNKKIINDQFPYGTSEYDIVEGEPVLSKSLSEYGENAPYVNYNEIIWKDGNISQENSWLELDFEYYDILKPTFSFISDKNDKKITLFIDEGNNINYVLTNKNGRVEFACPAPYSLKISGECAAESKNVKFYYEEGERTTLKFTNAGVTYTIYEKGKDFGIMIKTEDGKTYDWKGRKESKTGSLKDVGQGNCYGCG